MKIKLILILLAVFSLFTVIYLVQHEAKEDKAYVLTKLGCLKTEDTISEFDNRQVLMAKMNLPVYQRCN